MGVAGAAIDVAGAKAVAGAMGGVIAAASWAAGREAAVGVPAGEELAGGPRMGTCGLDSSKKSNSLVGGGDGVLAKGKEVSSKMT